MTGKRTRYGADFKAKVALDAIRGELTTSQLATKHGVHQTMINDWKRMAIASLAEQPLFCKFPRGVSFGSIAQASMVR